MKLFALALGACVLLTVAPPSLGQSNDELTKMRREIDALKESQQGLQRDLQDIKALLRARMSPPPEASKPLQTLTEPVALSIDGLPFLGSQDARVTLVEFSDFQCPYCAKYSRETLPAIVKDYVDAGKIRYVLRDFPIESLHPRARKSHEAAHCAGDQGKYWDMHQRLFGNIRGHEPRELTAHAKALRLDVAKFDQCVASHQHASRIQQAIDEGRRAGVRGTPSFFVGVAADGRTVKATRMLRGAQPYDQFKAMIDAALAESR